ncbi:ATP-binding cassette, subfamily B, heavy metal transporter [Pancytospora epiphaga]|nr:ATP-binding cassette, subfamily B, heavy metal transporter [Pancytospora epiphaga]
MKSKYTNDWLYIKSRYAWIIVPLLGILIVTSNWLEINCACSQIEITQSLEARKSAFLLILAFALKKLISFIMNYLKSNLTHKLVARLHRSAIKLFFDEYINLKYASFMARSIGTIHHAINKRASAFTELLSTVFVRLLSDLCFLIFVGRFIKNELSIVALVKVTVVITLFLIFSVSAHRKRAALRKMINAALEKNTAVNLDILMNYERIKAFDNVELELDKYYKAMDNLVYYQKIYEVTYEILSFVNQFILLLMTYFVFIEYNKQVVSHENIMLFILLSTRLRDIVYDISRDIDSIFISFSNLSVTDLKKEDYEDQKEGVDIAEFQKDIVIKDLRFSYNGKPVLKDVNCRIQQREKVAIVGSTGSGKSTFIRLILGLYDYSGSIKIDGVELKEMRSESLRKLTGFVSQQPYLFNRSIMSNLLDGNQNLTNRQIVQYMKNSRYHQVFINLGYDKIVGERGCNLSGGQRQKLCLARAIISDKPLLVLDRPCSSMDTSSEEDVTKLLKTVLKEKTVIGTVDNISSLANYDKVLYFDNQTICCQGTFDDLMKKNSIFYQFYKNSV